MCVSGVQNHGRLNLNAPLMNGRSLSNPTAQAHSRVQRIPRCERAQHKFTMAGSGSEPPFAFAETLDDAPAAKPSLVLGYNTSSALC